MHEPPVLHLIAHLSGKVLSAMNLCRTLSRHAPTSRMHRPMSKAEQEPLGKPKPQASKLDHALSRMISMGMCKNLGKPHRNVLAPFELLYTTHQDDAHEDAVQECLPPAHEV